ncbi:hypothetical protein ADL06_19815 [Streptomyces sp. NRRL F-6491]|nr:hypothetical protein ADL06_19815 [Streptomyces sp. NRRL F-6491]KOX39703.1 hypothetical protein ADL08_24760 [Streptomyces sp. NRRL F-6492]
MCLVALLALLTVWAVTSGGGGGKKPNDSANGSSPTPPSITPGPSGSGPAISQQPGGRDESGDEDETSGGNGGTGSGGAGSGGTDAGADAGTGSGGADSAGSTGSGDPAKNGDGDGAGGDGGAGTGAGQQLPADSPLPNCPAGSIQLTLKSVKVTYEAGEKPRFQLIARNTSAAACKADFGPRNAVLTISDAKDDEIWSSAHCPRPGTPLLLRLPAGATVTHAVEWDRGRSAPQCATAPAGKAGPGTYLVEAAMPGVKILPASFTLAKD